MSRFIEHFEKVKRSTKSIYNSSKIKAQVFASDFNGKFHTLKDYTKSDLFEDDIDQSLI